MKKLAIFGSIITALLTPIKTLAADPAINILAPEKGFKTVGNFITNALTLALAFGGLMVVIMILWGAFEWITSGGDKENVSKARNRIINALIGLAVLAAAFALARVFGQFTGLQLENLQIPSPDPNASGL